MAILAQNIIDRVRSSLDSEDTNHWSDSRDIIPMLNNSVMWALSLIEKTYGSGKLHSEALVDSQKARVFETNKYSRVNLSDSIWGVLAVFPKPETEDVTGSPPSDNGEFQSLEMTNLIHISSDNWAKNLTIEQWSKNRKNPFEDGNEIVTCSDLVSYAYLSNFDYIAQPDGNDQKKYIEIRPKLVQELVTIFTIDKPPLVSQASDNIPFNSKLETLLYEKTLSFLSYKMGENISIKEHTQRDSELLISLFGS